MVKKEPSRTIFWHLNRLVQPVPLRGSLEVDVAIIGGGMAGISAAQHFANAGKKVAVLEKYFCGAGASGLSTGFVTANAELGLSHFVKTLGQERSGYLWNFVLEGSKKIKKNIKEFNLSCDLQEEDTLIFAHARSKIKEIQEEYESYKKLGLPTTFIVQKNLAEYCISNNYYGAMRIGDTFGINCYEYLQQMKEVLQAQGVMIYEETPALLMQGHLVKTPHGCVRAEHIIVCADKAIPDFGLLKQEVFKVQTFVLVSEQIPENQIKAIFPHKRYMAWDTDLVYNYFRVTGDNRFMIGGASLLHSFRYNLSCFSPYVFKKLSKYVCKNFPALENLHFEYMWPGMLGITPDLHAIAGYDKKNPAIYYIAAPTGLAWASALGMYAQQAITDKRSDFDAFFSPERSFILPRFLQYIMTKPGYFSLTNLINLKR